MIPVASGLLLVGILSEGWPPHSDGEKSIQHPARRYNTTIRAPFFSTKKKEKKKEGNGISQSLKFQILYTRIQTYNITLSKKKLYNLD